jgi:hypothetical protein
MVVRDDVVQVATAVLSTTAKAKLREARKEARKSGRAHTGGALGPSSPTHMSPRTTSVTGEPDSYRR